MLVCGGVLLHAFGLEPFQVPTGSIAPAVMGNRRVCTCPHCGMIVDVGRCAADRDGHGGQRCYARSCCPNCGQSPLPVGDVAETAGDHILVNKAAFVARQPRRWEVIVFRLFGIVFIKRVAALPGEAVLVKDGDVYIDGRLARKSFAQAWAMRVPVFVQRCRPASGWAERWPGFDDGADLLLDGRSGAPTRTYCNGPAAGGKYPALRDEYAYNAGRCPAGEAVARFPHRGGHRGASRHGNAGAAAVRWAGLG